MVEITGVRPELLLRPTAHPGQELVYLIFAVPLEPPLRGATLFMSCMDKTGPDLAGDYLLTMTDSERIRT